MLNHLYSFYQDLKQDGVIFCFSGPTSQGVLEGLGQTLRRKMELEDVGMNVAQRIFSIFVEQVQNIIHYSAEKTPPGGEIADGLRHGVVVVGHEEGAFYVICGNKVSLGESRKILTHLDQLSSMNKQELRQYYKDMRRNGPDESSKGAGLGFIEMFRRACEPLEYRVSPIDGDNVFFSIKAKG